MMPQDDKHYYRDREGQRPDPEQGGRWFIDRQRTLMADPHVRQMMEEIAKKLMLDRLSSLTDQSMMVEPFGAQRYGDPAFRFSPRTAGGVRLGDIELPAETKKR